MVPQSSTILAPLKVGKNAMKASTDITGLASDSRAVQPGYLFAALSGTRDDGARFVDDAVARGAIAVLGRPELAARAAALGVRFIAAENPRLALAHEAAKFFGVQPRTVAAITGTNGKTSVTVFLRQIWAALGQPAASLGTIGAVTPNGTIPLRQTTPDPIELHALLAQMKAESVEHLAVEASSHGLDQYRLDGVDVSGVAFTNITRDHLDYHPTFEHYIASKLRLFTQIVRDGGVAVVNADAEHAERFIEAAAKRGLRLVTVGEKGSDITLLSCTPRGDGQTLSVRHGGRIIAVELPLAGSFQASNALVAAGLAIGLGNAPASVFATLAHLKGAPGRLEQVAVARNGAPIYVDYAHTPDALETVLKAIRPHTQGRLHLVFGCGGDRDKGKRPLMGEAAARLADAVIVTDDNPRSEDPAEIRREILVACPGAREIGDRAEAIRAGVAALASGDVLVIAGKGHESGQTIGAETRPFSDRDQAVKESAA
ncbi:MAG TPA: UDP-N-acetylmuramoyl-L-alanyl-D-glutamate--2,6-diaminopimelate ligase [Rhizomicrobium sp.]|jgi:UDP-N-acetylmuramoyl-L-alanyl-D-glutamate--2,6-diaminopimelate ligase|nr:UDP-N-acetylmuramoyl-L-alanyl-D-glutamate--2,6-diaminopimelate ligase [Rhizomicrobium sp.]